MIKNCSKVSADDVIGKLFPSAIIYLQSALLYYGYTDRIPFTWQMAVDKNSSKSQYKRLQLQLLLNLFCQEEFLRRIGKSIFSDNLILKGGFILYSLSGF